MATSPMPRALRWYVAAVIGAGTAVMVARLPWIPTRDLPLFGALLVLSCVSSGFTIPLPLWRGWASTSASEAFPLTSLLVFGIAPTLPMAAAGAWIQTIVQSNERQPLHRQLFNAASLVVTIELAGQVYSAAGGVAGQLVFGQFVKPLLAASTVYFLSNSLLVAAAVAISTNQRVWRCWHDNFFWSAPGYYVSALVASIAAVLIARGEFWLALLIVGPLALSYRAYRIYFTRLEDEQQRLAVTLHSIAEGVIATDLAGRVSLLNPVAEGLTGWTEDRAVGRPLTEVLHVIDRVSHAFVDPLPHVRQQADAPEAARLVLESVDGRICPIEITGAVIRDHLQRERGFVFIIRDVTMALRAEDERMKASKLESLGLLAGGIAHDFNNVLTAVVGNLALLRSDPLVAVSSEVLANVADAERACLRARTLTQQLLTFSRGGDPIRRPMLLARLIEDATRFALRGSNVRAEISAAADLWPVLADEGQLERVIGNVVINAMQAMPGGGIVRVRASNLTVDAAGRAQRGLPEGQFVEILIHDDGVGIAPEHLHRIFDPYFTTKKGGSGLGLAAAHSIVKNHGGFVTVESSAGQGTTFGVYLPRTSEPTTHTSPDPALRPVAGTGRVLVMDDELTIRDVTAAMLRRLGYECETASDGTQAIERVRDALRRGRPFDAAIVDLTVPGGMGGEETAGRLRQLDPTLRMMVFSGYSNSRVLSDYEQFGFSGRLTKPFTLQDLAQSMHELVRRPPLTH